MEYAMTKNGNSWSSTEFWNRTYRPYIRTVEFGNDLSNLPSSCATENLCWDISYDADQKKRVYGYLVDSGLTVSETDSSTSTTVEKTLYNLYIVSETLIFASNCEKIFSFSKYDFNSNELISNLIQINFNDNFNTSEVTSMKYMFSGCISLTSLDLSSFDTSQVTDMGSMFYECSSLKSLDLSSFNTSQVTSMKYMFYRCLRLTSLDLSNFNTSKVTDMSSLFNGYSSLVSLDLSSFDTSNVANMSHMFSDCTKIQVKITIMNPNMTAYDGMFSNALNDENAYAIINYTIDTQSIAESMKSKATYPTRITLKQI